EDERKFFGTVTQVPYVLMLAENWCGDVHRNSPLIAHISEAMPHCELRVFFRDQNPDLRDTFLNNGYQSIPVVVFFDRDWNEIGSSARRARALARTTRPRSNRNASPTSHTIPWTKWIPARRSDFDSAGSPGPMNWGRKAR